MKSFRHAILCAPVFPGDKVSPCHMQVSATRKQVPSPREARGDHDRAVTLCWKLDDVLSILLQSHEYLNVERRQPCFSQDGYKEFFAEGQAS